MILTKKILKYLICLCVILFLLLILAPTVQADKFYVREVPGETYEKSINKGEEATYIWDVENDDPVIQYHVVIELEEENDDWQSDIFPYDFKIKPNETVPVKLTVSTESRFDGDMQEHKLDFKFSSENTTIRIDRMRATTIQDIPESEKKLTFGGIDIPLPDALSNMLGRFAASFLLWVVTALLSWFILKIVMARITKKTVTDLDDKVLDVLQTPLILLIVLYGVVDSLVYLELTPARISQIKTVYDFGLMLITMWTAFRLFRIGLEFIAERWVKKKEFHIKFVLIPLIEKLGKAVFFTVLLILILGFFGVDLTAFMAGAGIIGLVVAFAAQDTLANFFAGIFLIMEPKFKVNDTITFENEVYTVRTIGLRTTQLYDIYQNMDVIVPNHTLATSKLVNLDEPDKKLRITLHIPVALNTDIDKLEKVIREVSKEHLDIITDNPKNEPLLYFHEFGAYYLDFKYMFWIENLEDRFFIRQRVFKSMYRGLREAQIEVPLPQTVYSMGDKKPHDHPFVDGIDAQAKLDSYREGDPVLNRKNNTTVKMKLAKKQK